MKNAGNMMLTVIHHEGRLPMFGIGGELGARIGRRLKAAIGKAKSTPILERAVGVAGRVETDAEGHSVVKADASAKPLKLGSGHLYARTSNAHLLRVVLDSLCHIGSGGIALLDAEPSYHSLAAMDGVTRVLLAEGSSSLISAMHVPLDRAYHAAMREQLRLLFGAEFSMRELLIALPCAAALEIGGTPGRYAVRGAVPLHDLMILNDCDGDKLEEFCMAEAPVESTRRGGRKIKELANEMVGRVRGMKDSAEMPGTSW